MLGERTSAGKRQDWNNGSKLPLTLKQIYEADNTQEQSLSALSEFEAVSRGDKFPSIGWSWHNNWEHITPFFAFSKPARKLIYMTKSIESLNSGVRKAIRRKGHFTNDETATKLIWLALCKLQPNGRIHRLHRLKQRVNLQ